MLAISAAAWTVLIAWASSPMGRLLDHQRLADGSGGLAAAALATGRLLMVVAMMLPSLSPLLAGPRRHVARVIAGFLGV